MKENSIKEYVKILEKFSNENVIYGSTVGMTLEKYKDLQLSAEHILSDYKRVLKENEKLNSLIKKLEKDSKEQQWIQTVDDEYFASTDKAMYADELLSFLRGEE